jgi:hypothetical protein
MRTAIAAATLTLAAAVTPASGVPEVRQGLGAGVEFRIIGNDRAHYSVTVVVDIADGSLNTAPDAWLYLFVARCDPKCAFPGAYYNAPLTPQQYDIRDEKNVSVRLTAFGKPFVVTWRGDGPARPLTDATVAGTTAGAGTSWPAVTTVTFLGRTCTARGGVSRGTSVLLDPTEPSPAYRIPSRAPKGQPSSARSCVNAPSS